MCNRAAKLSMLLSIVSRFSKWSDVSMLKIEHRYIGCFTASVLPDFLGPFLQLLLVEIRQNLINKQQKTKKVNLVKRSIIKPKFVFQSANKRKICEWKRLNFNVKK